MALRSRQAGVKFRRQQAVGPYIADFLSYAEKIIIEIDGDSHDQTMTHDRARDRYLRESGFLVLRFSNLDVWNNLDGVLEVIAAALSNRPPPRPSPAGGEGAAIQPSPLAGEGGAAKLRRVRGDRTAKPNGGYQRA